jgi:hypothetical protein
MLIRYAARQRLRILLKIMAGSCLALAFSALFSPLQALAHDATKVGTNTISLTLQVDVGFDATFRAGYWTPVHIGMSNGGVDFAGTLTVSTYSGPPRSTTIGILSPWSYQQPVTLAKGAQKQFTIYVPYFLGNFTPIGVVVNLRDMRGKVVATQTVTGGYEVKPGDLFVGLISDLNANFDPLRSVSLPNQTSSPTTSSLDASTMPTIATALDNFDVIVLADFTSSTLSRAQLSALQSWVNRGGILIEVGGQDWQRTLGNLPAEIVPVVVNGTGELPAGTHLLPKIGPVVQSPGQVPLVDTLTEPVIASMATLRQQKGSFNDETLLSFGAAPLITRSEYGQGVICYLGFDPARPPLLNWQNTGTLWRAVLLQALGDKLLISSGVSTLNSGPGQLLTRTGVISIITPQTLWGPWIIAVLLISYLLILGPVRYYIVKKLKRPRWGWPIIFNSILIFSLLAYGLAFFQRGASLSDNSVSIIQIDQGGSMAHVTTYMGIYVPNQGVVTLHIPGESLAQPIANQFLVAKNTVLSGDDVPAAMITAPGETVMKLADLGPWTFHPLVLEQDRPLQGNLSAHLSLRNTHLVGTVTNTLSTSLSDVYVLLAHTFVRIGNLAAGETLQVDLPLNAATGPRGMSLADQIAESGGLTAPYFPYLQNDQPGSAFQRHMALLSALEGAGSFSAFCGGSCSAHSIANRGTIYLTGGKVPLPVLSGATDPLLVTGAPATLIAWADQPIGDVEEATMNGGTPTGQHENFMQMPLSLDVSGGATIPPGLIAGHLEDIQGFDAAAILPGVYILTTGSLSFAFTLPVSSVGQVNALNVTVPDLLASAGGPSTNIHHLQASLFNWQSGGWDTTTLGRDSFGTTNPGAYIDQTGRVLVRITNQNTALGKLYFGVPSLGVNGGGA